MSERKMIHLKFAKVADEETLTMFVDGEDTGVKLIQATMSKEQLDMAVKALTLDIDQSIIEDLKKGRI